ncbi:hypothetical protein EON65_08805 [archaeon]|nr:MAG: hypothetical protein EON65_08805 [archaeon]
MPLVAVLLGLARLDESIHNLMVLVKPVHNLLVRRQVSWNYTLQLQIKGVGMSMDVLGMGMGMGMAMYRYIKLRK